jgi:cytochrome c
MPCRLHLTLIFAVALSPLAQLAFADDAEDARMTNLALSSGCLTCHSVKSGQPGPNGMKPIGPAWQDVAAHYRNDPGAAAALVTTVQRGSSAYAPHWKAKVSGYAMPPNAVAISEGDTRSLVAWILSLK